MDRIERNWTPLPFLAGAALISAALCAGLGYADWFLFAGMLLVWFCAAFAGLLLLYVLYLFLTSLFIDASRPQTRYERYYSAMTCFVEGLVPALARVRIHVSGGDKLPEGRFLLVSNHRSNFDPLVTGWALRRRRMAFILKPSIGRLPIVGPYIHRACYLAIDRENDREALKTILAAAKLMKGDVVSFAIYPEGTRNTGTEMLPFRAGAFKIAQRAEAPIVAAAIRGTENIKRNFPWRSTDVWLDFRAVLDAETVSRMNTSEIGEEVRKCITFAGF